MTFKSFDMEVLIWNQPKLYMIFMKKLWYFPVKSLQKNQIFHRGIPDHFTWNSFCFGLTMFWLHVKAFVDHTNITWRRNLSQGFTEKLLFTQKGIIIHIHIFCFLNFWKCRHPSYIVVTNIQHGNADHISKWFEIKCSIEIFVGKQ